jgi:hypothetical protein
MSYDITKGRTYKARSTYLCKGCGEAIRPGETYIKSKNSHLEHYGLRQKSFFWAAYKVHATQDCLDNYWKIVKTLAHERCADNEMIAYQEDRDGENY